MLEMIVGAFVMLFGILIGAGIGMGSRKAGTQGPPGPPGPTGPMGMTGPPGERGAMSYGTMPTD